jgi:alcohol dehydrogenase YqhD (iron-dependent ADH family)
MENFRFHNSTEIIFGKETENSAGSEIKKYADTVLLHYGGDTIKKIGLYEKVIRSLKNEGIKYFELSGVEPNPTLKKIYEGIKICRDNDIKFILAIGGGSVIDSAKAIALGVPFEGDVWDFFMGKAKPKDAIALGVILTVPAAGSESSVVTVIKNEKTLMKKGLHCHMMLPKFAILNPELTFSISAFQTACGAADILAHVMERYFTQTKKADLTDRLCEGTMRCVIENTPIVLANPKDYDSRAEIMWASTIAHNGILGTGRVEDWGSHKLGHELGAVYGVAHGASLAVIFPAWMKYVYKYNIKRFVQFADRVWGIDPCFGTEEEVALKGIGSLVQFHREIMLPVTLKELGITDDRFAEMAEKELQWGTIGNFVKLNKEDIINIFKIAK